MPTPPTLVILSAPEDAPFVARLGADLATAGYGVQDIAGERLHEDPCSEPGELRRRIEPAHAVLVAVSPHAVQSEQVRCEIEFARLLDSHDAPQRVVPVVLAPANLPHSLKNLHPVHFTAESYEAALKRLTARLATLGADAEDAFDGAEVTAPVLVGQRNEAASWKNGERTLVEGGGYGSTAPVGPESAAATSPAAGAVASLAILSLAPVKRVSFWRRLFSRR
jgi:hypothetical protein